MAVNWGPWEYSGGNGMRVGLDITWTEGSGGNIDHNSAKAKATVEIWTENQYSYGDDQKLSYGGSLGGSTNFYNGAGGAPVKRATKTYTYDYGNNEYGSSPGNRTFSASLSGAYNGVTPSKSITSSIPARPIAKPNNPTNVSVSRVNDTSQKVTWTNKSTSGEPWDAVNVDRDIDDNNNWGNVSKPGGGSTSATDSSTSPNQKIRYRVRAENDAGNSDWIETGVIYTTPSAPSGADRTPGTGSQQIVSWANKGGYSEYETEVWVSRDGTWSLLATVGSGTTQYTDTAASNAQQTKYKVRHRTTSGVQETLYSSYSNETSETAGITNPPAAPTGLTPSGITADPTLTITFNWTFNTTDSSAQTKYQVRHRVQGSPDWTTTGEISSATASYSLPADTYGDGDLVEWQVRTWGSDPLPSPYSASATFNTAVTPIAEDPVKLPVLMDLSTGQLEASASAYEAADYARRFQSNIIGGGIRSVSASYEVDWSDRFISISLGRSATTFPGGHHDIKMPKAWTVTTKSLTSNVATLTVSTSDMMMRPGETITVSGVGAPFDGQWVVRSIEGNKVRYDCVAANVGSTGSGGSVSPRIKGHGGASDAVVSAGKIQIPTWHALYYDLPFGWGGGDTVRKNGVVRVTNKALTSNVATLTVVAPHYFAIGDRITVSIGDATFDGEGLVVTGVTQTTISYAKTAANVSSTAVGSAGKAKPEGKDTFYGNFHMVNYKEDFVIPDSWVMIALRNVDSSVIEWGTGDTVDPGADSDSPIFKRAIFTSTTDASADAGNEPPLRIGNITGNHLRVDGNEIISMANDSSYGDLILQKDGGETHVGKNGAGGVYINPNLNCLSNLDAPNVPTGSYAANANINSSNGRLRRDTSSARYKEQIQDVDLDAEQILSLRPQAFQRNDDQDDEGNPIPYDPETAAWHYGFIAEQAEALGLLNWVVYKDLPDGTREVDGFAYDKWVVALQAVARKQQAQINDLEARLAALEGKE